ncbi:hypothetical protein B0J11DRAFT_521918 [Dendryphion nanum]|uniref:Uncharacterized protein n=1 Tax=Dendryphion nanum TaxID=256645 RepID=A0A9P9IRI0_9PLEO|nr:hypothetical protein B0J11DRAFT_521918 [Dendryphion nanum]
MATAPHPTAPAQQHAQPQDQSNASSANPATPELNNLQAMFALVLITTGRYLREQHSVGGSGRMQYSIKRSVPAAKDRFNNSLDQLEDQLHLAQAVVRRELALLQQDRIKREQAEQAERQRRAAESTMKKEKDVTAKRKEEPVAVPVKAENTKATQQSVDPPKKQEEAEPTHVQRVQSPPPPIKTSSIAPARDPLFDETPVTAAGPGDIDFDFDAEFGDSMGDVSNGHNQDIDMGGTASDLNFLAGLEDFAKSDDNGGNNSTVDLDMDFPMPDLSDMNTTADNTAPIEQPAPAPAPAKPAKPVESPVAQQPADISNDANLLDGGTQIDDLEDLFNMDYENPEDTQFNDAFFPYD